MAENSQTTDLAVSDSNDHALIAGSGARRRRQNPDLGERSSSKFDMAVGDLDYFAGRLSPFDLIRVALIVMLFFKKEPEMRPLGLMKQKS